MKDFMSKNFSHRNGRPTLSIHDGKQYRSYRAISIEVFIVGYREISLHRLYSEKEVQ